LPPRVQQACDLLSETGLEPVASGAGADGGAIPVDLAVLLSGAGDEGDGRAAGADGRPLSSSSSSSPYSDPRVVAIMLDGPRSAAERGGGAAGYHGASRRRASNPPYALLGAAEADARLLTTRLGWSSVARLPWFEWDTASASVAGPLSDVWVRLRGGGGSTAGGRQRRRQQRQGASAEPAGDEDDDDEGGERGDAALLAWVHNKVVA
jgi:hypothetical protein